MVGKILGRSCERLLGSLIRWNNRLVARSIRGKRDGLLFLIPVCLQRSACEVKVLENVHNCQRCGRCRIRDLVELSEREGIDIEVVSGGRLAKEMVERKRPEGVLACACEKELATGIFESYPVPVYGIINERPEGPCKNTQVDIKMVLQALGITDLDLKEVLTG